MVYLSADMSLNEKANDSVYESKGKWITLHNKALECCELVLVVKLVIRSKEEMNNNLLKQTKNAFVMSYYSNKYMKSTYKFLICKDQSFRSKQ